MAVDLNNTLRDAKWRAARNYDEFTYQWAEDVACIDCVCGEEIILSETLAHTCDCGRTYRYLCRVEVIERGPDADDGARDRG